MNSVVGRLVQSLVSVLVPCVLEEVIKALEEIAKADLNKDGQVGFGKGVRPDA